MIRRYNSKRNLIDNEESMIYTDKVNNKNETQGQNYQLGQLSNYQIMLLEKSLI